MRGLSKPVGTVTPMHDSTPGPRTRTLHTVKDADGAVTSRVRRTVLSSGLRILTEQMAGTR